MHAVHACSVHATRAPCCLLHPCPATPHRPLHIHRPSFHPTARLICGRCSSGPSNPYRAARCWQTSHAAARNLAAHAGRAPELAAPSPTQLATSWPARRAPRARRASRPRANRPEASTESLSRKPLPESSPGSAAAVAASARMRLTLWLRAPLPPSLAPSLTSSMGWRPWQARSPRAASSRTRARRPPRCRRSATCQRGPSWPRPRARAAP